jgi:hypothetical protein
LGAGSRIAFPILFGETRSDLGKFLFRKEEKLAKIGEKEQILSSFFYKVEGDISENLMKLIGYRAACNWPIFCFLVSQKIAFASSQPPLLKGRGIFMAGRCRCRNQD